MRVLRGHTARRESVFLCPVLLERMQKQQVKTRLPIVSQQVQGSTPSPAPRRLQGCVRQAITVLRGLRGQIKYLVQRDFIVRSTVLLPLTIVPFV